MGMDFDVALDRAQQKPEEEWPESFALRDPSTGRREEFYYRIPDEIAVATYMSAYSDDASRNAVMFETKRFLRSIMDPESFRVFWDIMTIDPDPDGRKADALFDIIHAVIEESSGRPTKPSSASTRSQRSGGRASTGAQRPKASTRSRSPRTASTTSSTATSSSE